MSRPTKDQWGVQLALVTAQRATCCRRSVGCVLVNSRGHVLATGYNGRAAGLPHCNEAGLVAMDPRDIGYEDRLVAGFPHACAGATAPSGQSLDACEAIHAEQNALITCHDVWAIETAYITASPCITCVKILMNTSCKRIVFVEEYPHQKAKQLWESMSREWIQQAL